ncbi:hypothetical protein N8630_03190 [Synechococcus sp. AH-601-C19]|nr:hypothetical protein [Synechococcus sp. AH-601-C19]
MNDNNDQYVIDPVEDVAFLLTYQNDSELDTLYIFRGQLDRVEESLWREQALVYMCVHYGLDAGTDKIDGFHWLDAIQLDRIGYLDGGLMRVEIVDKADFARLPLWIRRWRDLDVNDPDDNIFLECASIQFDFQQYAKEFCSQNIIIECLLSDAEFLSREDRFGPVGETYDPFWGLTLPTKMGTGTSRGVSGKVARSFR